MEKKAPNILGGDNGKEPKYLKKNFKKSKNYSDHSATQCQTSNAPKNRIYRFVMDKCVCMIDDVLFFWPRKFS